MVGRICKKIGMSRIFRETGEAVPVTYLKVEPNVVVRTKTAEKDGYNAIILGVGPKRRMSKDGKEVVKYREQKEWQVETLEEFAPGKELVMDGLAVESLVTIVGVSKGKGFQGVQKRHKFAGGPASHGSHFHRKPGSIGMRELPGRVHAGKRMAGRMGGGSITLKHRPVVAVDSEHHVIAVKGPIPGPTGAVVFLTVESPSSS